MINKPKNVSSKCIGKKVFVRNSIFDRWKTRILEKHLTSMEAFIVLNGKKKEAYRYAMRLPDIDYGDSDDI